jgi:hypothetical protein
VWFSILIGEADLDLEAPYQRFEFFGFLSLFYSDLSDTPTRCSVKYPRDIELLCCLILDANGSRVTLLASSVIFRCYSRIA